MRKEIIFTNKAPKPKNPYSQATRFGNLVFTSGQTPRDPSTGKLIEGDMHAMVRRTLENIRAILDAAGSSLENVLKITCYLNDMKSFPAWNDVYREYFPHNPPARMTVQVILGGAEVELPLEVEVIACVPDE